MHADFELGDDGTVRSPGWGGARRGAGRKPADYEKPQAVADFEIERALHEKVKRERAELELKKESGLYVSRDAVQQAAATALATLAQGLRSIPDNLERKGLDAQTCALIEQVINEALDSTASDLEMMAGNPA